ncbi:MAG: 3-deoxy-manno-octulosonate cytidylyltransferase [Clostridium sp.]|nr:3-deoxy-manno-octulosonate cytidylyltransferase [Clostridium sp.]
MKFIGIIPARYASTRFPGKPLADMLGKPMIQRVYERVVAALGPDNVAVATDDRRILEAVEAFGGRAVMTSETHRSGTDRCHEAYIRLGSDADVVINIQGDEPFIDPGQIRQLAGCFDETGEVEIATLIRPFPADGTIDELRDPNRPKVVVDNEGNALMFSRSVIPYLRGVDERLWPSSFGFHTHIGMYGYRAATLARLVALPPSPLETAESLEQLRWLSNGFRIRTAVSTAPTIGIDTPGDMARAIEYLKQNNL